MVKAEAVVPAEEGEEAADDGPIYLVGDVTVESIGGSF